MNAALELRRVSMIYDGAPAVSALVDVSLAVEPGVFCLLEGMSGSGKTTLLGLAGGLERPTLGRVNVDGTEISSLDPAALAAFRRRQVGFVFQDFKLIAALTAEENVELPLRFLGETGAAARRRSRALLGRLGLDGRLNRKPSALSGGEKQRVAIARALVHGPALVLADEPTANLDTATGRTVIALLREVVTERGATAIVATHDHRLAGNGTRVLRLADGRILEGGDLS